MLAEVRHGLTDTLKCDVASKNLPGFGGSFAWSSKWLQFQDPEPCQAPTPSEKKKGWDAINNLANQPGIE